MNDISKSILDRTDDHESYLLLIFYWVKAGKNEFLEQFIPILEVEKNSKELFNRQMDEMYTIGLIKSIINYEKFC